MKTFKITGKLTRADGTAIKNAIISIEQEWIPENVILTNNILTGNMGEFTYQFMHKESSLKLSIKAQLGEKVVAEQFLTAAAKETNKVHLVEAKNRV